MHTPVDLKKERIRGSLALFDSRGGALAASSLVFQLHFYMCVRTLLPPPSMHFHLCSASILLILGAAAAAVGPTAAAASRDVARV